MLVSVIISNYNYGRYIADAIQSVLVQNFSNIEIIVVDDGSTDNSAQVIRRFHDQIALVFSDHEGHAAALNKGFSKSSGDAVIFLDADDWLLEGAIEKLTNPFRGNPSLVKTQGYLNVVDEAGNSTGRVIPRVLTPSGDYSERTLNRGPWTCRHAWTSGNAWSRWFLETVFPLPEGVGVKSRPDGCLNTVSTLFGPIVSLKAPVACYRIHGSNYGPAGIKFDAESLKKELESTRQNLEFFAEWSTRLGYTPPIEYCQKWGRSWRDNLMAYSVSLMDKSFPRPRFHELVLAPMMAGETSRRRAPLLSGALGLIWLSPRQLALALARRLLGINLPPS